MVDATAGSAHATTARAQEPGQPLTTRDGRSLRDALRRSGRVARRRAFYLVLPILAFLLLTFAFPIVQFMARSVYNPTVADYLPNTASAIGGWDGTGVPGEDVFAAMAKDMAAGYKDRMIGRVAAQINRELPGYRSVIMGTARQAGDMKPPYREKFLEANKKWGDLDMWRLVKRSTRVITPLYYLLATDFHYDSHGNIVQQPPNSRVYRLLFFRTVWMSGTITLLTILLGYPVSYLLAALPLRKANLLMILVLLPFWTSLLVRTAAWIVILQREGVLNDLLVWLGVINNGERLRLIYNQLGTIIAMTHILLPFMILPLYSVMKTIPPSYMRAARSLGAGQVTAFRRVYLPLTIPGLAAGVLLVFILAIGYYITPALVGGDSGIFISNMIAQNMQSSLANLKLGAALSTILLAFVLLFYWIFNKLIGVDRLKFG